MKFIVLIVVMGLRRMDLGWSTLLADDERHQRWLQRCGSRIGQPARVWWVAVLLPAVLIGWAACWLSGFWASCSSWGWASCCCFGCLAVTVNFVMWMSYWCAVA